MLFRSAIEAARAARRFGMEPRVALLAYSTFGQPRGERSEHVRGAVKLLEDSSVDFEFDGEMAADVALIAHNLSVTTSNLNRAGLWGILWGPKEPRTNRPAPFPGLGAPRDPFR